MRNITYLIVHWLMECLDSGCSSLQPLLSLNTACIGIVEFNWQLMTYFVVPKFCVNFLIRYSQYSGNELKKAAVAKKIVCFSSNFNCVPFQVVVIIPHKVMVE